MYNIIIIMYDRSRLLLASFNQGQGRGTDTTTVVHHVQQTQLHAATLPRFRIVPCLHRHAGTLIIGTPTVTHMGWDRGSRTDQRSHFLSNQGLLHHHVPKFSSYPQLSQHSLRLSRQRLISLYEPVDSDRCD